jgi:hypothetical protein
MENETDKFEFAIRILGNEVFAFSLSSASAKRNFIVTGMIITVFAVILLKELVPVIQLLM